MQKTPVQTAIEIIQHAVAWNVEGTNVPEYTWQQMYADLEELKQEERLMLKGAVGVAGLVVDVDADGNVTTIYGDDPDAYYRNRFEL